MQDKDIDLAVDRIHPKLAKAIEGEASLPTLVALSSLLGQIGVYMEDRCDKRAFILSLADMVSQAYDDAAKERLNG